MSFAKHANLYLKLFGFFKVPLIYYCRPKVLELNAKRTEIRIRLRRRTKNHLNSMYFGTLAVGADVAGGLIAMMLCEDRKLNVSLAFKSFKAEFLKRPEGDVHFICEDGEAIRAQIDESLASGERINRDVHIRAIVPKESQTDSVAEFVLTLSLKVKKSTRKP
jgi:acyl-coenzyme A thioesterase PaaI-like protein